MGDRTLYVQTPLEQCFKKHVFFFFSVALESHIFPMESLLKEPLVRGLALKGLKGATTHG